MILELNNKNQLNVITVNGSSRFFQGQNRDSLEIQVAKTETTFDELDNLFANNENTSKIKLMNENQEFIYNDYTLRVEMSLKPIVISQSTSTEQEVTEERYSIVLAQKTYIEKQLDLILASKTQTT